MSSFVPRAAGLPIELIYLIISSLSDADDRATLSACSLVCRSWNEICRPHIFHTIAISHGHGRADERISFLLHAAHLSDYIHGFSLHIASIKSFVGCWNSDSVGQFKNLRALRLEHGLVSMDHLRPYMRRYQLPPLSLVATLLAAPCLQILNLSGWTFLNPSDLYPLFTPCSKNLEQLKFEDTYIQNDVQGTITPPSMNALRNLDFLPLFHPRMECPRLETLSLRVAEREEWALPSWIPSTLRALTLHATARCALPDLGSAIRPSEFTIHLSGSSPYSRFINWARNCINRLPFPEHLRRLAIDFKKEVTQSGESMGFAKPEDYQNLSQVLQKLLERCPLERIDLIITINASLRGNVGESDWRDETTREVHVFEEALLPLLKTGILHVVFAFNLQREVGGEVLLAVKWMTVYRLNTVSTPPCSFVLFVPTP